METLKEIMVTITVRVKYLTDKKTVIMEVELDHNFDAPHKEALIKSVEKRFEHFAKVPENASFANVVLKEKGKIIYDETWTLMPRK